MKIDESFWKEFDRRLDAKLDGGVDFDDEVRKTFENVSSTTEFVGYIELNGNRFSVKDKSNGFGLVVCIYQKMKLI